MRDLREVRAWIARDDARAAARWIAHLRERARLLCDQPELGRVVPEIGRADVRELVVRRYRLVYRVAPDHIDVLTVFEGHRLLPPELGD